MTLEAGTYRSSQNFGNHTHVLCITSQKSKELEHSAFFTLDAPIACSSNHVNPLNTERRLLYLKTQFVPRSKHFSSRL